MRPRSASFGFDGRNMGALGERDEGLHDDNGNEGVAWWSHYADDFNDI